ncbi:MAG TPA: hypothetical protein VMU94_15560 [Streptosporangiaceae bacterium]|nr:hypothetical protein [Streptosporangiaceae bacterium]
MTQVTSALPGQPPEHEPVLAGQAAVTPGLRDGARRSAPLILSSLFALTKPRIIELLLVTTLPVMLLARHGIQLGDGGHLTGSDLVGGVAVRACALALGGWFLTGAGRLRGQLAAGAAAAPMRLFHASIAYLTLLFTAVAVTAIVPWGQF